MHDQLITELTAKHAQLSPAVHRVIAGTRQLGLHKVAAFSSNAAEYNLQNVIYELGTKLAYDHLKRQKIASGLRSLNDLEQDNVIKLANVGLFQRGVKKTLENQHGALHGVLNLTPKRPLPPPIPGGTQITEATRGVSKLPSMPPPSAVATERVPMGRLPLKPAPAAAPSGQGQMFPGFAPSR